MTTAPITALTPPTAPKYQRTVITTTRTKAPEPAPAALLKPLVGRERGGLVVVADGRAVQTTLDASLRRSQVVLADFRSATRQHEALLKKYLGKTVPVGDGKFAALAASLADGGLF